MTSTPPDPARSGDAEVTPAPDARLADLEFKLAFLEREMETWKEAVDALHARLERTEAELHHALRVLREGPNADPYFARESSGDDAPDPVAS